MEKSEIPEQKLSKNDIERYCRQMLLSEISTEGQLKIKSSSVLIVGAGGLGSPCLLYLAGAGIGKIGIVDGDVVEESNLHRQIIHSTNKKGINKSKSAADAVKLFNPEVNVVNFEEHLSPKNAVSICSQFDLLIDCSDNPATRYLVNDTACYLNKPLVSGSAVKFEGQLTIYNRKSLTSTENDDTPCYRCLFPLPTPSSAVCNCSDGGVFGPIPGVIGVLQASEAVKLIIGLSDKILSKKMLLFDGLDMKFKVINLRGKTSECVSCSNNRIFKNDEDISKYDYQEFINPVNQRAPIRLELKPENNITWEKFIEISKNEDFNKKANLIDCRSKEMYDIYHIDNFVNFSLNDFKYRLDSVIQTFPEKSKETYIMCRRGNQSTFATKILLENGYENVINIEGGITDYKKKINPNIPEY